MAVLANAKSREEADEGVSGVTAGEKKKKKGSADVVAMSRLALKIGSVALMVFLLPSIVGFCMPLLDLVGEFIFRRVRDVVNFIVFTTIVAYGILRSQWKGLEAKDANPNPNLNTNPSPNANLHSYPNPNPNPNPNHSDGGGHEFSGMASLFPEMERSKLASCPEDEAKPPIRTQAKRQVQESPPPPLISEPKNVVNKVRVKVKATPERTVSGGVPPHLAKSLSLDGDRRHNNANPRHSHGHGYSHSHSLSASHHRSIDFDQDLKPALEAKEEAVVVAPPLPPPPVPVPALAPAPAPQPSAPKRSISNPSPSPSSSLSLSSSPFSPSPSLSSSLSSPSLSMSSPSASDSTYAEAEQQSEDSLSTNPIDDNEKFDAFIARFHEEIRMQREETVQRLARRPTPYAFDNE